MNDLLVMCGVVILSFAYHGNIQNQVNFELKIYFYNLFFNDGIYIHHNNYLCAISPDSDGDNLIGVKTIIDL